MTPGSARRGEELEAAVGHFLRAVGLREKLAVPPMRFVIVRWRGRWLVGALHELHREIVYASLTTYCLTDEFVDEIRRQAPGQFAEVTADRALELTGRGHILARRGNRLETMNPEETRWAVANQPRVVEM